MKVVTHNKGAHVDDFLSCCVLLRKYNKGIIVERRPPLEEDFESLTTWVVDQGQRFDPDKLCFDHHHLKGPPCAFTMITDYLFEPMFRDIFPWVSYIEAYDTGGGRSVAALLKSGNLSIPDFAVNPATSALVAAFSKVDILEDGWLKEAMYEIGDFIYSCFETIKQGMEILDKDAKIESYGKYEVLNTIGLELPESPENNSITKIWSKLRSKSFDIILAEDRRTANSFRMISAKEGAIKFVPNELSSFTHTSGFLTVFSSLDDWKKIIDISLESKNE